MTALQERGVPAGVCQTAEDRCEHDPQLEHLNWLVELNQAEMGRWPVKEVTGTLSRTPGYVGGFLDRHGPNYGEDTEYVLAKILGMDNDQIEALRHEGIV